MPSLKIDIIVDDQGRPVINQVNSAMKDLGNTTDQVNSKFKSHSSEMGGVQDAYYKAAAGIAALTGAMYSLKSSIDAALKMEQITSSMKAVTSSLTIAARETQYVREESERLGLVFSETAVAYAKFSAATRNTSVEGEETRKIFSSVAEAATALRLPTEQVNGVFIALGQMMSKGKVQAEELRGQLGERLPGAFQMAADAMGVTTAELNKMLEDGKVLGSELLPKLAEKLHETYGVAAKESAEGGQAAINRFNNSVFETKRVLGEELMPTLIEVMGVMREMAPTVGDVIRAASSAVKGVAGITWGDIGMGVLKGGGPLGAPGRIFVDAMRKQVATEHNNALLAIVTPGNTIGISSKKSVLELSEEQRRTAAAKAQEDAALAALGKKGKGGGGADLYANALRQVSDETKNWADKIAELDPYLSKEDSQILKLTNDAENLIKKIQEQGAKGGVDVARQVAEIQAGLEQGIIHLTEKNWQEGQKEFEKFMADEAEYGMNENERAANAIIAKEEEKLNKLKDLWWKGKISDEQFNEAEVRVHSNTIMAKLDKETEYNKKRAMLNYDALEDIRGMEEQAFRLKMELIDAEAAKRIKDGADYTATVMWTENKKQRALVDFAKRSNSIIGGMNAAWYDLYQNQLAWGQASYTVTVDLYKNMGDAFGRSFYDVITGDLDDLSDVWDNFWKSMLQSMTNQLGQMAAQWLLFNTILGSVNGSTSVAGMSIPGMSGGGGLMNLASMAGGAYSLLGGGTDLAASLTALGYSGSATELAALSAGEAAAMGYGSSTGMMGLLSAIPGWGWAAAGLGGLAALFGGDVISDIGSGIGDVASDVGDFFSDIFHEGGVVGMSAVSRRAIDPLVFAGAPRLHGGLASDEFPAILQRGETVVPKGQGATRGDIHIYIDGEEAMRVTADGVIVERNKRGVSPLVRVY